MKFPIFGNAFDLLCDTLQVLYGYGLVFTVAIGFLAFCALYLLVASIPLILLVWLIMWLSGH